LLSSFRMLNSASGIGGKVQWTFSGRRTSVKLQQQFVLS